jgi:hypothetical protein
MLQNFTRIGKNPIVIHQVKLYGARARTAIFQKKFPGKYHYDDGAGFRARNLGPDL